VPKTTEYFDHGTNTLYRQHVEDVEPLIDHIKEQRNHGGDNYRSNDARWRKVGELPMTVIHEYFARGINLLEDSQEMRKFVQKELEGPLARFRAVDKF
jgi:hypothetical protein